MKVHGLQNRNHNLGDRLTVHQLHRAYRKGAGTLAHENATSVWPCGTPRPFQGAAGENRPGTAAPSELRTFQSPQHPGYQTTGFCCRSLPPTENADRQQALCAPPHDPARTQPLQTHTCSHAHTRTHMRTYNFTEHSSHKALAQLASSGSNPVLYVTITRLQLNELLSSRAGTFDFRRRSAITPSSEPS